MTINAGSSYDTSVPPINDDTIDHHCFGCGNQNPMGLRLRFRPLSDESVWATFTPTRDHEGYMGMTHGGIISTVLDEAMSWAVTHAGDLGVTARMSVTFRKPIRLGQQIRVEATVVGRKARAIDTHAVVYDAATEQPLAEADGRFMRVTAEQAAAWRSAYGDQIEESAFGAAARRNAGLA
ncbi:MAG TPA: PaaI family thioesterase [Thermomicrobiales bacterium]|nr:PaaI family thioesterase [Thermomicrobiales bacterium]